MTFGQPWLLLGALAGVIPLAVHLFDRRKPRPHPFAAIAFVLRSQRRTASRLKLKRLLLYTLRTLILLAIPVALARPELRRPGAAVSRAVGPAATVVVVDRGLAMRFVDAQSLFEKARTEARSAVAAATTPVTAPWRAEFWTLSRARVDGASEFNIFTRIVLPLSVPVLAAITVFTFLYAWNDFQGPLLYLTSPQHYTMALGLQDFKGQRIVSWNLLMAASVVFTIPIIIAFFFAQKTFIQGIKLTGLKE